MSSSVCGTTGSARAPNCQLSEQAPAGLLEGFSPLLGSDCGALDAELSGAEFLGLLTHGLDHEDGRAAPTTLISDAEAKGGLRR